MRLFGSFLGCVQAVKTDETGLYEGIHSLN